MSKVDGQNRLLTGSSILSFLLIVLSLFTIVSNQCTGYELSIYSNTNVIYWICVIYLSIHIAVLLTITNSKKYLAISILELLFLHAMLLLLFVIRGYIYLERADTLSYIGMALDVCIYDAVPEYNYYPVYSIFISLFSEIGNIEIVTVAQYLPTILSLFSTICVLCYARVISDDPLYLRCTLLSSIPIAFAWYSLTIFHMTLATLMLPITLLTIARIHNNTKYCLILYPFLIIAIFGHPLVALLLLLIIITITATRTIVGRSVYLRGLYVLAFFGVVTAFWYISKYQLMRHFSSIIKFILGNTQLTSSAADAISLLDKTDLLTAIRSALFMVSDELFWSCAIMLLIVFMIFRGYNPKKQGEKNVFDLTACFVVCNMALLVSFFLFDLHTPYRLINLNPTFIFAPILSGYILYRIWNTKRYARVVIAAIIFVSIVSIFGLYMSPITNLPTDQVTATELSSAKWLIDYKDESIKTMDEKTPFFRFVDMQYGYCYKANRTDLNRDYNIPDHFGIDSPVMRVDQTRYLLVSDYVVEAYSTIWHDVGRFSKEDFEGISYCKNILQNYDSNGAQIYTAYI